MKRERVAICHASVLERDAIGCDIISQCEVLESLGFTPEILCNLAMLEAPRFTVRTDLQTASVNSYAFVLYHHSIYWAAGERVLERCRRPVAIKYHNITPPEAFRGYSKVVAQACADGREQTARLARAKYRWLADSPFNQAELLALGVRPERAAVAAPFHLADRFLDLPKAKPPRPRLLIVGRIVPNKGHLIALRILRELVYGLRFDCELVIVGKPDLSLFGYLEEIEKTIGESALAAHVGFVKDASAAAFSEMLSSSSAYLCTSTHEGFCVPVLEAQAARVPLLVIAGTAAEDTAGPNQLIVREPRSDAEVRQVAEALRQLLTDEQRANEAVAAGVANLTRRFSRELIENQLVEGLLPILETC